MTEEIYHTKNLDKLPTEFYLVSYGSNGFLELATMLEVSYTIIQENSLVGKIDKCRREFFSYSFFWKGSIATIVPHDNSQVFGIILKINRKRYKFYVNDVEINFKNLCDRESLDQGKYILKKICGVGYRQVSFRNVYSPIEEAWAFVGNERNKVIFGKRLNFPSHSYTIAIQEMLIDRRSIYGKRNTCDRPRIDVFLR